jgi:hypothetical protein
VKSTPESELLRPLHEAIETRKRLREDGAPHQDDPACAALFSGNQKGRSQTDAETALITELQHRRWRASSELVEIIIQQEAWTVARQLLALPELDEDLAVRLLAARTAFLPAVVRRTSGSQRLAPALRRHIPAKLVEEVLELLLELMDAHKAYTLKDLRRKIPGFPHVAEIVGFFNALSKGCFSQIIGLDVNLLERVVECLSWASHSAARRESLHAAVSASTRLAKAPRLANDARPVEVSLLPL